MGKHRFKGTFSLLDYNISHKVLLLRNTERDMEEWLNTDIIFETVFFMEMPTRLNNITLYEGDIDVFEQISTRCIEETHRQYDKVFVLESEGKKYYIGCFRFLVKENNLNPLESSIKPT